MKEHRKRQIREIAEQSLEDVMEVYDYMHALAIDKQRRPDDYADDEGRELAKQVVGVLRDGCIADRVLWLIDKRLAALPPEPAE